MTTSACMVFALLAGHWYFKVWETFGNPLFPQFNALFHGPLAQPMAIADTRWLPRTWSEQLIWPWVFTLHPRRVSEIPLRQISWGILYLLALGAAFKALMTKRGEGWASATLPFLLVFFAVAYVLWQVLFSIHRYLVVLELLSPLLVWLGCRFVLPVRFAGRLSMAAVAVCAFVALWGGGRLEARAMGFEGIFNAGTRDGRSCPQHGFAGGRGATAGLEGAAASGRCRLCVGCVEFPGVSRLSHAFA